MIVLGLHFGHDANMSIFKDGNLLGYFDKERKVRVKHALGLSSDDIFDFLTKHSIHLSDVDICVVTTTQDMSIIDFDGQLEIALDEPARLTMRIEPGMSFIDSLSDVHQYHTFHTWADRGKVRQSYAIEESFQYSYPHNRYVRTFDQIATDLQVADFTPHLMQDIRLSVKGVSAKKSYFVAHHLAHANYAHMYSPFKNSLTISFDGGGGFDFKAGGIFLGMADRIISIHPHGFWGGWFYERVSQFLGLGTSGGPGKMMGLAAYGMPIYAATDLTGLLGEMQKFGAFDGGWHLADFWLEKYCDAATPLPAWDGVSFPPERHANIAASAQRILEQNALALLKSAVAFAKRHNFRYDGIVLSGGVALNCPANSLINELYGPVFCPPAVNDEGLSLGAALLFNAGFKRPERASPAIAYLGDAYEVSIDAILKRWADKVYVAATGEQAIELAARDMQSGKIIGFFHGSAEIGPRALGHRSILASPLLVENVIRVNKVKSREPWRPLAPIATEQGCAANFTHVPKESYFMLFNGRVNSRNLPAVTHVDGTARVQIATPECGPVYDLIRKFGELTGYEVLLNTSFNGKTEPIVETPDEAVDALLRLGLDGLYLDGYLLYPRV